MKYRKIKEILTKNILSEIESFRIDWEELQEIRIRVGQPVKLRYRNEELSCKTIVGQKELKDIVEFMSNYSLHAYENEFQQGYLTIEGGHRVGIAGQIKNRKNVSSINIRVSHERKHCADKIMPYVMENNGVCHTLIVSPPRCGKTTLLRDLIRQLSDGSANVGVVDERSELAGCYQGIPQNDVGSRTDVLDACSKKEGMMMLIRSMSPDVIAVDEIGGMEEVETMKYAMHCGVKIIATVHGNSMEEIRRKPLFEQLIKERCFERYVVLRTGKKVGEVSCIFDERGNVLYRP